VFPLSSDSRPGRRRLHRGYPPGAPTGNPAEVTWHHRAYHVVGGPVAFLAIFGACLTLAGRLLGAWRLYTVLTAVVGLP
jgi:hypothetical protein